MLRGGRGWHRPPHREWRRAHCPPHCPPPRAPALAAARRLAAPRAPAAAVDTLCSALDTLDATRVPEECSGRLLRELAVEAALSDDVFDLTPGSNETSRIPGAFWAVALTHSSLVASTPRTTEPTNRFTFASV